MEYIFRENDYQNWITFLLVGSLITLTIVKFYYNQRFIDFFNVVGADRFLNTRSRGVYILHPFQLALTVLQFIGISLLTYIIYCLFQDVPYDTNFNLFLFILLGYSLFEILKFLVERFVAYTLHYHKKFLPFFYKKLNVKNILGLFALICCAIISYRSSISPYIIYSIISIITVIYIISQIWLLGKYKEDFIRFPFYFILYFCTLEIGPYYILYKFITK